MAVAAAIVLMVLLSIIAKVDARAAVGPNTMVSAANMTGNECSTKELEHLNAVLQLVHDNESLPPACHVLSNIPQDALGRVMCMDATCKNWIAGTLQLHNCGNLALDKWKTIMRPHLDACPSIEKAVALNNTATVPPPMKPLTNAQSASRENGVGNTSEPTTEATTSGSQNQTSTQNEMRFIEYAIHKPQAPAVLNTTRNTSEQGQNGEIMATSATVKQPTWYPPRPLDSLIEYWDTHYPLRLFNSLTRTKTAFVPMKGKRVLWYMCGPTVYDQTHLGHGRTYTCFDYVRRILEDYFGYEVELVMNVTDIDDKIIIRAAENGWLEAHPGQELPANKDERTKLVMEWSSQQPAEENMRRTKELSKYWEKSFLEDMALLNIKTPAVLTRVSEYVPEIIEFVEGIIKNNYAYESNGSVYFDTVAFGKSKGKAYGKLLPENVGQSELLAEGEGSLSLGKTDKRNVSDFVLWKKSKKGEPFWQSPWGEGRPGWHIECSAMASDTIKHLAGGQIDIHSGGIDLRFPHHDNEIAQSEAYFDFSQWVNYFVHTGHLNIEGLKMSKSLKNFVKIQEALMDNTSRQLRFLFLLHKYNTPMDYNDNSMDEAVTVDRFFSEFFQNVKAKLRELGVEKSQKWTDVEKKLNGVVLETKEKVHIALADDLNTPLAILHLQQLAKEVNRYMASDREHVSMIIRSAAEYITHILGVFGLVPGTDIGFPLNASGEGAADQETVLAPVLDIFAQFRDQIREAARSGMASGSVKDLANTILNLCDDVRDEKLPHAGVRLEDRAGSNSIWKLANKEELLEELQKKADEKLKKEEQKRLRLEEDARKKAELEAKAKVKPEEMFLGEKDKYSKFDDQGIPTHDAAGEPLSKGQIKKLAKEHAKQKTLYEKHNQ